MNSIAGCCAAWFPHFRSTKLKFKKNINSHVHYFFSSAFNCVSGPFFSEPLEVKPCKAYLAIKHCPSLTPFFLLSPHAPLLPSFFSFGPFSASSFPLLFPSLPCLFLSGWPSQQDYRVLTCLHLPPTLADQWGCCAESPSFSALPFSPSQLKLSVFPTSDPRPWQQGQECQE